MTEEEMFAAEKLIQQLKAEGWQEQRSGTCCINGTIGSNLFKDGQVIKVQQDLRPDEELIEQEWCEDDA